MKISKKQLKKMAFTAAAVAFALPCLTNCVATHTHKDANGNVFRQTAEMGPQGYVKIGGKWYKMNPLFSVGYDKTKKPDINHVPITLETSRSNDRSPLKPRLKVHAND